MVRSDRVLSMPLQTIAIVGAGLSGLALAILLRKNNFDVTLYELRDTEASLEGAALSLAPNGLQVLDALGLVSRIFEQGYRYQHLTFRNNDHKYLDAYTVGNEEAYGFDACRVYRYVLLSELKRMAEHADIPIVYNHKFAQVEPENAEGITFAFTNGSQYTADLLIGGRHPQQVAATAVPFPSASYAAELPVSIHGPAGAVHIALQNAPGTELVVAMQWQTHERTQQGWDELNDDKQQLRRVMSASESWNDMVKSAVKAAPNDSFTIWPHYTVPQLARWYSEDAKVIILGDSAHAVPPTGGQGVNQSFEDVYVLSLLLAAVKSGEVSWKPCLSWWQRMRQERVRGVKELAAEITARRAPGWTGEDVQSINSDWLYGADLSLEVRQWLDMQQRSAPS